MFTKYEVRNEFVEMEFSSYSDCVDFVMRYREQYCFSDSVRVSENVYDNNGLLVYSGKIFEY